MGSGVGKNVTLITIIIWVEYLKVPTHYWRYLYERVNLNIVVNRILSFGLYSSCNRSEWEIVTYSIQVERYPSCTQKILIIYVGKRFRVSCPSK